MNEKYKLLYKDPEKGAVRCHASESVGAGRERWCTDCPADIKCVLWSWMASGRHSCYLGERMAWLMCNWSRVRPGATLGWGEGEKQELWVTAVEERWHSFFVLSSLLHSVRGQMSPHFWVLNLFSWTLLVIMALWNIFRRKGGKVVRGCMFLHLEICQLL